MLAITANLGFLMVRDLDSNQRLHEEVFVRNSTGLDNKVDHIAQ